MTVRLNQEDPRTDFELVGLVYGYNKAFLVGIY